jgi:glycosyltransferase involved in cell wall biosynthesis
VRSKPIKMPEQNKPLVSIITPSFNQAEFIESTILSVAAQDYPNLEYIVIDGASTDGTVDVLKAQNSRITYWESVKDKGQTDAIIKGFERANGKYISWLCSDDILEPSMISISVAVMESNPDVVLTYGDRIRLDAKGNVIGYHRFSNFRPWLLKWGFAIPQETILIRRSAYEKSEGLNASLKMAMDFDLFCKLSKRGVIKHIPGFLGRFRSHSKNKSTIFDTEVRITGFIEGAPKELTQVYLEHFGKKFPVWKWKHMSMMNEILAFFDRRKKQFKADRDFADKIRS